MRRLRRSSRRKVPEADAEVLDLRDQLPARPLPPLDLREVEAVPAEKMAAFSGAVRAAGEHHPPMSGGGASIMPYDEANSVVEDPEFAVLKSIEQRVLWLACRIVDYANHERPNPEGSKVGGHQASCASIVTIMTALWFNSLNSSDRVAVKPHASPVFHAIQYLLGELNESDLLTLRQFGGLQAYPSRTKDRCSVDYSTGSVGLGAAAPLFGAAVGRYLDSHFEGSSHRSSGRFISLIGDAELDEGNVWEAIVDPATQGLGNVIWIVDLNRQSLDRVVPGIKAARLEKLFGDVGWHVVEAKYGKLLQKLFAQPGGEALRTHIDEMPNEEYQSLFAYSGAELRQRFCAGAPESVASLLASVPDDELAEVVQNLGGHDLPEMRKALAAADAVTDRPTVIFAYTVKGWGLPIAGDPRNHSALLSREQIDEYRARLGLNKQNEFSRFETSSPEAKCCAEAANRIARTDISEELPIEVPEQSGLRFTQRQSSTQEMFGRLLVKLAAHEEVGKRLVTTSPDVAVSTSLGGWINKVGVFSATSEPNWMGEGQVLNWAPSPKGQHIELGISEMNLFLLLGQLGLTAAQGDERLIPIGTVYDPFVLRGLDALVYGTYSASRFIIVGTPSGVALSYEGGAHQSTLTPSIGLELPGIVLAEPAYAGALDWLLCDGISSVVNDTSSMYLRLTTRMVDQSPFALATERLGIEAHREQVLAGGYRLHESGVNGPTVQLVGSGAVISELLMAAAMLEDEGVAANVIDLTAMGRLYHEWRHARRKAYLGKASEPRFHLETLIPPEERHCPIVTVHDASSHAMSWIGSVFGAAVVPIGVDEFGQSGSLSDLYEYFDLVPEKIVNAALIALDAT